MAVLVTMELEYFLYELLLKQRAPLT